MAPLRNTDFKAETYTRLTNLTKIRFNKIKEAINKLHLQVEPLTALQIKLLHAYSSELQKKKDEYEKNFQRVLLITGDDAVLDETLSNDQDEINDLYIYISSLIDSLNPNEEQKVNSDYTVDNMLPTINSQVRLPKIELPKFTGDLASWTSFINLFDTTIHNNPSLTEVMKFQYLLSVLEKEPLNLIRSLNLTASNYLIAYNLLRDRYHNNRRLQLLHLNQLLDLPQISSPHIQGIRNFVNIFNENAQALAALECEVQESNPLLVAVLLRKMDIGLRKRLEGFRPTSKTEKHSLPTVKEIIDFLNTEYTQLEDATLSQNIRSIEVNASNNSLKTIACKKLTSKNNVSMMATPFNSQKIPNNHTIVPCFVCNQMSHKIYSCPVFKSKSPQERFNIIKNNNHCVSCLGTHNTKMCKSQSTCKKCNKRHHTLLHFDVGVTSNCAINSNTTNLSCTQPPKYESNSDMKPETSVTLASQNHSTVSNVETTVVLGTLLIQVSTPCGNSHVFRALLDSGSMCNLITENAANILNIRRYKSDIQLSGIDHHVTCNKGQIFIDVKTLSGQVIATKQPMLILDKLTVDLPRLPLSADLLKQTFGYTLADPTFHIPSRIDIVLGGALFPQIFNQEQFSLGHNMPHMLGTHFGYVIMGTAPCIPSPSSKCISTPATTLNACLHSISDADLHSSIQRFWTQEELPSKPLFSNEEILCDNHFSSTHSRDTNGRYIVRLPFKKSHSDLGESKRAAETRLNAMERKFSSNNKFSQLYHEFMDEYFNLGHMSKVMKVDDNKPHYFLPHHGVIKESSSTTKLRTVFDASCKTSSGLSLNDILLTGPKLQNNICDLILQFRRHNIVFCCDIRQMYRQIIIHPDDRQFQLILWRQDCQQPIDIFQLNTVTYGINSSPYLAIRTLHQLADDEGHNYPIAAHVLKHQTYVDDIITGADTLEEAKGLQSQLIDLLHQGGFELRKWVSNAPELLNTLPPTHLEEPKFLQNNSNLPQFSILGLQWSPSSDTFTYNCQSLSSNKNPTKRTVLSTIAQIFDPCGFLVPFVMLAKCFMQLLWTKGLSWDMPLPLDLQSQWQRFTDDLLCLSQITIPRALNLTNKYNIELHGFCDASELGFAAVTYVRCETSNAVETSLIMAKSRVAPLKRVSIPRLELCAAYLLANLVAHIQSLFPNIFHSHNTILWSDSTVALTWIQTPPYMLKTYVANRVSQIQDLTPTDSWKHIKSEHNPADCASRGIRLSFLIKHTSWWHGPTWLSLPTSKWPVSIFNPIKLDSSHEIKPNPIPIFISVNNLEWSILTKYSSWMTLVRVMAFLLRFIHNCRNSDRYNKSYLTTEELKSARNKIFYLVQQSTMADEFYSLSQQQPCSKRLQRLKPFIDSDNLIRVGGRINHAPFSFEIRHPIVLPKHHHIVDILIDYYHIQYLHAGPQLLQSLLSRHVWILCARSIIRTRIHKCIVCFRNRPKNKSPLMGDLPPSRTNPTKPFLSTGIDYGGPYDIKITTLRFLKHIKVYICLFVCMVTKAVHIEVATDLTTDAFIACLTRFMSRRGICTDIYSDCGTNFIGANKALRNIINSIIRNKNSQYNIQRFVTTHAVRFHFNPPAAPHHGGLWESAIKSAKYHLQRVIGNTILTLPDFITLTVRVEAMLNSRPLTPLSNDPSDLSALTPGHFLIGGPIMSLPEPDFINIPSNRLKHWQLLQKFHQLIWKRWSKEYLHTLQQRTKWNTNSPNLKIGDLVLVHSQSSPLKWPLGRITETFPGTDGIVRVVKLKTADGTLVRPVVKVFLLPNE